MPAELVHRPTWMADALCREPAYRRLPWVPDHRLNDATLAPLQAVCARCVVARECADYAASHPKAVGVFAGTQVRLRPRR